jgi:phosphoesterase RecJ-like protein
MSIKKAVDCIKKHKSFLITTHTHLEGDALGSELAFYSLLKKLGKRAAIINQDGLPYGYDFLPSKNIAKRLHGSDSKKIKFDCFVALDCSDLSRTGEVYKLNSSQQTILNIDHHISNKRFGDVNWVKPNVSCCCEMIYGLYKSLRIGLDRETALFLYVGILTDTGSFRYSNTTSRTHQAASQLLKHHLDVPQIYKSIYKNIPIQDVRLLAKILTGVRLEAKGKMAWVQIRRQMFGKKKFSFDLSEEVLSFIRAIKDVEVCVLFKENLSLKDEIRVNFRSQGKVDVNRIASCFGGGGHKTASGATIRGDIKTVRKKVLAKIREALV